ncbi:hypothetical protein EVAR_38502_1 [Eumeta japonica]|uniref:Uncharacterized protein n=1 Tax=Eumeta variegata TaxID=151549 RepID=A0A4C1WCA2_EUMVA|nr:hypothetical protein EVAR_38502_1 [Eumeta japonica]
MTKDMRDYKLRTFSRRTLGNERTNTENEVPCRGLRDIISIIIKEIQYFKIDTIRRISTGAMHLECTLLIALKLSPASPAPCSRYNGWSEAANDRYHHCGDIVVNRSFNVLSEARSVLFNLTATVMSESAPRMRLRDVRAPDKSKTHRGFISLGAEIAALIETGAGVNALMRATSIYLCDVRNDARPHLEYSRD